MCMTPGGAKQGAVQSIDDTKKKAKDMSAEDIPLGDGLAESARRSLIERREQLRKQIEAAGG